jgi:ribosomal protein S6--L-glutamate ligase
MQLAILGRNDSWHVQQLATAGRALGHSVEVVPFQRLTGWLERKHSTLYVGEFDLLSVERVYVRGIPPGSLEQVVFRMDALHRLHATGVPVLNPPGAVETCVDKYLATARLQAAGLPVPRTAVCESLEEAMAAFTALGGKVVVKPLFGSEGRGIVRIEDESLAYRVLRTLVTIDAVLYLQEYIDNPGWDFRAFVVGDRVVAAMRRTAVDDFRTNASRGGRCESCTLPRELESTAVDAAAAVGAPIAGVDILPDRHGGVWVLEVNSTPGFEALSKTTGTPIARIVMRFLAEGRW